MLSAKIETIKSTCGTLEAYHSQDGQLILSGTGRGLFAGNTREFWGDADRDYPQAYPVKPFYDFSKYREKSAAIARLDEMVSELRKEGVLLPIRVLRPNRLSE